MTDGSIKSCYFTTSRGRNYTITGTESGKGPTVWDAIDTVVNQEGVRKKMKRRKTIELINS